MEPKLFGDVFSESGRTTPDNVTYDGDEAGRRFVYYAEAVIQPSILAFGFLTNLASLLVLYRVKMASTFRTCLIALAMSDLCMTFTGFCQLMVEVLVFGGTVPFGHWINSAVASFSLYFLFLFFTCVSASLVILVAVIRNMIVLKPLKARCYFTRRRTKLVCFGVFLFTCVLFTPVPLMVVWQSCFDDNVTDTCVTANATMGMDSLGHYIRRYLFGLSVLYGPVLLITYVACVISIWLTLKKTTDSLGHMTVKRTNSQLDTTKKRSKTAGRITRTLMMILILDIVCTTPTVLYGIGLINQPQRNVYDDSNTLLEVLDVICEIFICCRPAYNFWLYFFHHEEFRRGFRGLITCSPQSRSSVTTQRQISNSAARDHVINRNGTDCVVVAGKDGAAWVEMSACVGPQKVTRPAEGLSKKDKDRCDSASRQLSDSFMSQHY